MEVLGGRWITRWVSNTRLTGRVKVPSPSTLLVNKTPSICEKIMIQSKISLLRNFSQMYIYFKIFSLIGDWFCISFKRIATWLRHCCPVTKILKCTCRKQRVKTHFTDAQLSTQRCRTKVPAATITHLDIFKKGLSDWQWCWISFVWLSLCIQRNFLSSSHLMVQPFVDLILDDRIGWWRWHHMSF